MNPIELQTHLSGVDYPASKDDLVASAEDQGAEGTLAARRNLPDGDYDTPAAVSKAASDAS